MILVDALLSKDPLDPDTQHWFILFEETICQKTLDTPWPLIFHFMICDGLVMQPDQMNMAVYFLYFVKSDTSVRQCTVAYTRQVAFYNAPESHGHVYLVTLSFKANL